MKKKPSEIEEWIQRYPSVRNWFLKHSGERRYKPVTEKANLECLDFWRTRLNKTPDELIPSNLEEAQRNQEKIMGHLLIEGRGKPNTILQHTTKYHAFCECNGFSFPRGGDEIRKIIRLAKWKIENESEDR